jgi:hypothetical protein
MANESANKPAKGRPAGRGSSPRPASSRNEKNPTVPSRITDEDIDLADQNVTLAFQILGLVKDGSLVCPKCGTAKPKKVEQKLSAAGRPYWTCHRCGAYGSATKLLRDNGRRLPQAVAELLGRIPSNGPVAVLPAVTVAKSFNAVVDVEVYNYLRRLGDIAAAQKYYARWHIEPVAVAEAGSTMIVDPTDAQKKMVERFGADRLRDCGLLTTDRNGADYWLVNDDYNVLEVHAWTNANIVGLQFRPSERHLRKVQAHKDWKRRWGGQLAADGSQLDASDAYAAAKSRGENVGPEHRYIPPFMSVKGAGPDSLIGCGLRRISTLPPGQRIYVVEGFKDLLAARTLGVEAYAIPGVGVMPPAKVCQFFAQRRDTLIVTLDGDEAGALGRDALTRHFGVNGVLCERKDDLRTGMDIADILVELHAHRGCTCPTCSNWRQVNPYDPSTCPCRSCKDKRG